MSSCLRGGSTYDLQTQVNLRVAASAASSKLSCSIRFRDRGVDAGCCHYSRWQLALYAREEAATIEEGNTQNFFPSECDAQSGSSVSESLTARPSSLFYFFFDTKRPPTRLRAYATRALTEFFTLTVVNLPNDLGPMLISWG